MSQSKTQPFDSQFPSAQSTSPWGPKKQEPSAAKPLVQAVSQQQSTRGRPRPKVQEKLPKDESTSSSRQEQSGAWVPEYAFVCDPNQQSNDPPDTHRSETKADQPRTQQGKSHPTQQQKQQPRPSPRTLDEDINKLSISNVSVASSTSSQSSKQPSIPTTALIPLTPNKGSGTIGKKVSVDVNFLPLIIDKLLPKVYQYDVSIEPNLPKRLLPRIFETYRQNNFKDIFVAFDGQKIAVSPRILPINDSIQQKTVFSDESGRERVYMVAMKEARDSEIDFQSLKK